MLWTWACESYGGLAVALLWFTEWLGAQDYTNMRPTQSSVHAMHARVWRFSKIGISLASLFLLARAFLQGSAPMPSRAAQHQSERGFRSVSQALLSGVTHDLTKTLRLGARHICHRSGKATIEFLVAVSRRSGTHVTCPETTTLPEQSPGHQLPACTCYEPCLHNSSHMQCINPTICASPTYTGDAGSLSFRICSELTRLQRFTVSLLLRSQNEGTCEYGTCRWLCPARPRRTCLQELPSRANIHSAKSASCANIAALLVDGQRLLCSSRNLHGSDRGSTCWVVTPQAQLMLGSCETDAIDAGRSGAGGVPDALAVAQFGLSTGISSGGAVARLAEQSIAVASLFAAASLPTALGGCRPLAMPAAGTSYVAAIRRSFPSQTSNGFATAVLQRPLGLQLFMAKCRALKAADDGSRSALACEVSA
ncbi:unnamed protein product [Polarella glacialis]|uniref:Uncharacterized protein n=1 Tax=Polarella glacialis TaxID=89957 RepID=A0A813L8R9_POLGL|nr:unnamed protein product [Polarella glacialis]